MERISHGVNEDFDLTQPIVLRMDCHHHLRNVWIGALNKHLSKYLDKILQQDLSQISFRYRVSTMMDSVLQAVDKEFSLPANYPKGHGDHFKLWMKGGVVNADTCNSARLTSAMLCDAIEDAVEEERLSHGVNEDNDLTQPIVLRIDCHHHLRNVWVGALNKHLSKYLDNILQQDLTKISFC